MESEQRGASEEASKENLRRRGAQHTLIATCLAERTVWNEPLASAYYALTFLVYDAFSSAVACIPGPHYCSLQKYRLAKCTPEQEEQEGAPGADGSAASAAGSAPAQEAASAGAPGPCPCCKGLPLLPQHSSERLRPRVRTLFFFFFFFFLFSSNPSTAVEPP